MKACGPLAHNARTMRHLSSLIIVVCCFSAPTCAAGQARWLDELDVSQTQQEWGTPHARKSVDNHPLTIAGQVYEHGLGTHAQSHLFIRPNGATRFAAMVGVDDEVNNDRASVVFQVLGDKRVLFDSGVMKRQQPAKAVDLDISGVKKLELRVEDGGD